MRRLAVVKAETAAEPSRADEVVLGADTTVVIHGGILGKPRDDEDAAVMLRQLSGRTHEVLTGVALRHGRRTVSDVARTEVQFAPLTDDDLAWYVASGEPRDKAGAYGIQGLASRFVESIDGSYTNVVGLPVALVARLVRDLVLTAGGDAPGGAVLTRLDG